MNEHPPFCDCDGCLNGSGGLVLPGAGVVHQVATDGHTRSVAGLRALEAGRREARINTLRRRARREGRAA